MAKNTPDPRSMDPDAFFAATRMGFVDHPVDLLKHLVRACAGFFVALFFGCFIGRQLLQFFARPVGKQLLEFYERRRAAILDALNKGEADADVKEANQPSEPY